MMWPFNKPIPSTEFSPSYQVGDPVWVSTFATSYKGKIVGEAPPAVMERTNRYIVKIYGKNMPVSPSLLSRRELESEEK